MSATKFWTAQEVAVEVMAALDPILAGVKVHVAKLDGDALHAAAAERKYDIEVEAPPEVQKMFHAMYPDWGDNAHYFHNYADTFAESFESAKLMVQQMAMDYEAFRRSGIVNGGRA